MVFTFFGPVAVMAAAGAGQGLLSGLGQMQELEGQADEVKAQEKAGAIQNRRDVQDAEAETAGAAARRRALLAASGAAGTAQSTALLDAVGRTGGQNVGRLKQDWQIQRSSLRARRKNLKMQAQNAPARGAILGGAQGGAQGYQIGKM